jgi:hypothetical protein
VHVEPQERQERADHRGAEHREPREIACRGDERDGEEREHGRATGQPVHPVGEVHAVRHRDDREKSEGHEQRAADLELAGEREVDARDAEVTLDVDRGDETDDHLPHELVTAADPKAIANVHEVVDRAEHSDEDERSDGHDRLWDEKVTLLGREKEQHEQPQRERDADEQSAAHRRNALLDVMGLRTLGADVLTDPESPQQADVRCAEQETQKEGREQHAEGEDLHLAPRY